MIYYMIYYKRVLRTPRQASAFYLIQIRHKPTITVSIHKQTTYVKIILYTLPAQKCLTACEICVRLPK